MKNIHILVIMVLMAAIHPLKNYAANNPVITLKGDSGLLDTMYLERGRTFVDPGFTAISPLYGDISSSVIVTVSPTFNNLKPGTYVFSYNVTDNGGNVADTKYRVVTVTPDHTGPVIKLANNSKTGSDTILQEVVNPPVTIRPSFRSYLISSIDLVDGNLTKSVYIDSSQVQTTVVGLYPVSYSSTDSSGNKTTVYMYVDVIDTIRPVLTLYGSNPVTIEVYTPYTDAGVRPSVPNSYLTPSELRTGITVTSTVNDSVVGTYKVTYNLTDTFGNKAIPVVRTVFVIDDIPPVIKLNGDLYDSIPLYSDFIDPGYTVSDNYYKDSDITVLISGNFYQNFPGGKNADKIGTYTIIYTATDGSGNQSSVTRMVKVYKIPELTLIGDNSLSICQNSVYHDQGYTLTDFDSSIYVIDTVTNLNRSFGYYQTGNYFYKYTIRVLKGGKGIDSVSRSLKVLDSTISPCNQSAVNESPDQFKDLKIYPNPANQVVNIDAGNQTIINIRMVNELGMVVFEQNELGKDIIQVPVSQLNPGVYTVVADSKNGTVTRQLFKN